MEDSEEKSMEKKIEECGIMGVPRYIARAILHVNGGDIEQAINSFYDGKINASDIFGTSVLGQSDETKEEENDDTSVDEEQPQQYQRYRPSNQNTNSNNNNRSNRGRYERSTGYRRDSTENVTYERYPRNQRGNNQNRYRGDTRRGDRNRPYFRGGGYNERNSEDTRSKYLPREQHSDEIEETEYQRYRPRQMDQRGGSSSGYRRGGRGGFNRRGRGNGDDRYGRTNQRRRDHQMSFSEQRKKIEELEKQIETQKRESKRKLEETEERIKKISNDNQILNKKIEEKEEEIKTLSEKNSNDNNQNLEKYFEPIPNLDTKTDEEELETMEKKMVLVFESIKKKFEDRKTKIRERISEINSNICKLCYERPSEIAFNCGHLYCEFCSEKVEDKCSFCRAEVTKKFKIFR